MLPSSVSNFTFIKPFDSTLIWFMVELSKMIFELFHSKYCGFHVAGGSIRKLRDEKGHDFSCTK